MKITITFNINDRIAMVLKKLFKNKTAIVLFIIIFFSATIVYTTSPNVGDLNTFMNSDIVYADTLNKNFEELYSKINELKNNDIANMIAKLEGLSRYEDEYIAISDMITQLEEGSIPPGIIAMIHSYDPPGVFIPPEGWAVCNGDDDTPNLTDKFIVGASTEDDLEGTYKLGDEGSPTHSHNMNHVHKNIQTSMDGEHYHKWATFYNSSTKRWISGDDAYSHYFASFIDITLDGGFFPFLVPNSFDDEINPTGTADFYSSSGGLHKHNLNFGLDSGTNIRTGETDALPPYVSLYYIMKLEE